jgi:D-beta-D-heptose 7-phosphate kinase/D-beta-D-heptose 1-phosphate adenosyltransferase
MLLSSDGKILKTIPTAAREVFDVSGAGDTSLAALVLALAAGAPLETAAQFANAAAGVVVGKIGTATVTPKELLEYVNHR